MSVHIKISDRNWILEAMAKNISSRLDYVSYDTESRSDAQIQYYLTYSTFKGRVSPIELAYFTHLEEDPVVRERFFSTAAAMDGCVCMAQMYADMLRSRKSGEVHVIPPGVDLETFDVKLRIGVVGRTYVTGRKGEALISEVFDTPGIEWLFTGDGWPGPALNLADDEMAAFYRSLDFVLVPARYEGGPMSAIEALACGVEVIAPDVGWMPELPHIPYKRNDAADLRRVLTALVEKRRERREAVYGRSWDNFAEGHDRLFRSLLKGAPEPVLPGKNIDQPPRVMLVTHGAEKVAKGGPSTRIPQLRNGLPQKGFDAAQVFYGSASLRGADLFHLFNVATPSSANTAMEGLQSFGRPIVFSPIYLDNRCRSIWGNAIPQLFSRNIPFSQKLLEMNAIRAQGELASARSIMIDQNLPLSYHQIIGRLMSAADELIYLSAKERQLLADATGHDYEGTVIPNPVSSTAFRASDPKLFSNAFGISDFVLCVGRIEARKNQLALAAALSGTNIPLVLVGESFDAQYLNLIRGVPDLTLIETGRLEAGSELLASAYAACRVFCLPSWSEGAPIAALEAGAAGCRMVLSTKSAEAEYFKELASYVDPGDIPRMRSELLAAFDDGRRLSHSAELADFVAEKFSVEKHVERTAEVYERLLSRTREHLPAKVESNSLSLPDEDFVYLDVTSVVNHPGRITGITRVELSLVRAVTDKHKVRLVAWHGAKNGFFHVDIGHFSGKEMPHIRDFKMIEMVQDMPANASMIAVGNGWLRNKQYLYSLEQLVRRHRLRLLTVVYDILPISQPQFFDPQQAKDLEDHLDQLSKFSSFCTESEATRQDLEDFFGARRKLSVPVECIRLGDDLRAGLVADTDQTDIIETRAVIDRLVEQGNFVLSVGSQLPHKNRRLIYQIWNKLVAALGRGAPTLVVVGKAGDGMDLQALETRTRSHVVIIPSVSDHGLARLYEHCLFTVFPSHCEGWGLPVAESLLHGKICISSDRFSMPEIAPEATDLIDPFDGVAWYKRVKLYATSPHARQRREKEIKENFQPVRWETTLNQLLILARRLPNDLFQPVYWEFETPFDFQNAQHCASVGLSRRRETKGSDEIEVTSLSFHIDGYDEVPLVLQLISECTAQGLADITINGDHLDTISLGTDTVNDSRIFVPNWRRSGPLHMEIRAKAEVRFQPSTFVLLPLQSPELTAPPVPMLVSSVPPPIQEVDISVHNRQVMRLLRNGWHRPEDGRIWSGKQAEIWLPSDKSGQFDLLVICKMRLFRPSSVYVRIGKLFLTRLPDVSVSKPEQVEFRVPAWIMAQAGTHVNVELEAVDAVAPGDVGIGADTRILGVQLSRLAYSRCERASVAPLPGEAVATPFQELLGNGWHAPQGDHVWSMGESEIILPVTAEHGSKITLLITSLVEQTLDVLAGHRQVTSVSLSNSDHNLVEIDLSLLPLNDGWARLQLIPSCAASPEELGINGDKRKLGVCLHRVLQGEGVTPTGMPGSMAKRRTRSFRRLLSSLGTDASPRS